MEEFELVDFLGDLFGGFGALEFCGGLEDGVAFVVVFVDVVDGDACFGVFVLVDGAVDVVAVHAFAAVFWEEGWVDVDDFVGEGLDDLLGHFEEEACEDYEVGAEGEELFVDEALGEVFFCEGDGGDLVVCGFLEDGGVGFVAEEGDDFCGGVVGEVGDDVLGVGSRA